MAKSNIEKFLSMSDADKASEVSRAEKAPGRPLTAAQRAKWQKVQADLKSQHAAKGRGRPVTGKGHKVISMSMEMELLARADLQAKKEGISRAALVARGLQAILK